MRNGIQWRFIGGVLFTFTLAAGETERGGCAPVVGGVGSGRLAGAAGRTTGVFAMGATGLLMAASTKETQKVEMRIEIPYERLNKTYALSLVAFQAHESRAGGTNKLESRDHL